MTKNTEPPLAPKHELKNTTKLPSLKEIIHGVSKPVAQAVEVAQVTQNIPQKDFKEEELFVLWKNYLQRFKDKGDVNECLILDREITLQGHNIVIRLDNVIQEDHLNSFKMDLLEYLRRNLNNNLVNIIVEIKEESEIKKLYTSKEKYLHIAEKYPLLEELKYRLGLELDE